MATNEVQNVGANITAACTEPTTPASGDPVLIGQIPGVALAAEDTTTLETVVATRGVYSLSVGGETVAAASSAVAVGDILYYDSAATPKINKDTGGVRFGYALGTVAGAGTGTIDVKLGY